MHTTRPSSRNHQDKNHPRRMTWFVRWLHVYLSMLGLIALLFFSVTGITVNHPDWFSSGRESIEEFSGQLPIDWITTDRSSSLPDNLENVDKLSVVERFRKDHGIRGSVNEFSGDEYEIYVGFNGPAYTAFASINRETGDYLLSESTLGFVALINDLHKGRDTGTAWSWVIDISAIIMIIASLSGLYLLLGLNRRKSPGLKAAAIGGILLIMVYFVFVP